MYLYESLSRLAQVVYVGPVNPGYDYPAKFRSKFNRLVGWPGSFHYFSKRRLDQIAKLLADRISSDADCNLFFGNTPWIHCDLGLPYFVYTDCSFPTYLKAYHDPSSFSEPDVERIRATEQSWLHRAEAVFVAAKWSADALRDAYGLPESKVIAVGMGGALSVPQEDIYETGADLVFIGYDFDSKGGQLCFDAMKLVAEQIPEVRLIVIGGPPDDAIIGHDKVKYLGVLSKNIESELKQYQSVLAESFLLICPSLNDIGSACIFEAGYYGCPAIAPRRYCYVDQVKDQISGTLVDLPLTAEKFAHCILDLFRDKERYRQMRVNARAHALQNFTWDGVAKGILREITEKLAAHETRIPA